MRLFNAVTFLLAAACAVGSCVKQSQDVRKDKDQVVNTDAYNIARDSKQELHDRLQAATQLSKDQKEQLQTELLKEVPGNGDLKTRDAISLLAKVGDMTAAERLQQFLKRSPYDISTKISTVATFAIEEIREREMKTNP